MKKRMMTLLIVVILLAFSFPALSQDLARKANGQLVYIPGHTFLNYYLEDDEWGGQIQHQYVGIMTPFIRSLEPVESIRIDSIKYTHFTPEGVKEEFDVLTTPLILGPFETMSFNPLSYGIPFDYTPDYGGTYRPPFYLIKWSAIDKGRLTAPMIAGAFTQSEQSSNFGGPYRPITQTVLRGVILEEY